MSVHTCRCHGKCYGEVFSMCSPSFIGYLMLFNSADGHSNDSDPSFICHNSVAASLILYFGHVSR